MPRFIEGQDRHQITLLPKSLDDFIAADNAVQVVDAFVNELDMAELGFEGVQAAARDAWLAALPPEHRRHIDILRDMLSQTAAGDADPWLGPADR